MEKDSGEIVIPVLAEQIHVDTVAVQTGGVRIVKRTKSHEELIEQQLRADNVTVKRVPVNRIVDGPQPVTQTDEGDLIIPIVQEVLKIERHWVVTEELHVSRSVQTVLHQETVKVYQEEAVVERFETPSESV